MRLPRAGGAGAFPALHFLYICFAKFGHLPVSLVLQTKIPQAFSGLHPEGGAAGGPGDYKEAFVWQ